MHIPTSALEPFGYTGIPTIKLQLYDADRRIRIIVEDSIRRMIHQYDEYGTELIDEITDLLERAGAIHKRVGLHLSPDNKACLIRVWYQLTPKTKIQRMLITRKFRADKHSSAGVV
jgi:hypothetical protein